MSMYFKNDFNSHQIELELIIIYIYDMYQK
jgi:hypothetical protein